VSAATRACDVVPFGVDTVVVCSQSGAFLGTRFWKNDGPAGPFREALEQHRPPPHGPHQRLRDPQVVLGQVGLGLPALGEQHLVRVGDEAAAHGVSFLGGNRLTRLLTRSMPPGEASPGGMGPAGR